MHNQSITERNEKSLVEHLIGVELEKKGKKIEDAKIKNKKGLYSYLERDILEKKEQSLTKEKILSYAEYPNNKVFPRLILERSRKYLKKITNGKNKER